MENSIHTSDLSKIVTAEKFEEAYKKFIEQADQNVISNKSNGSQTPFGFVKKPECEGAHFCQHFGWGNASTTPYINWWVVSIYYIPISGKIILGIEESRYPHLNQMTIKPSSYAALGRKNVGTAVFYSTTKLSVNYSELYENFIQVCEEVMRLGLK